MSEENQEIELTEEELRIGCVISRLLKSGHLQIGVNLNIKNDRRGYWNVTNAYAYINNEYIQLDEGSVEIDINEI
tara:strand:- start:44 stop:268 length:225 start_codon:yes stop_codon:yes gene_type:complete